MGLGFEYVVFCDNKNKQKNVQARFNPRWEFYSPLRGLGGRLPLIQDLANAARKLPLSFCGPRTIYRL